MLRFGMLLGMLTCASFITSIEPGEAGAAGGEAAGGAPEPKGGGSGGAPAPKMIPQDEVNAIAAREKEEGRKAASKAMLAKLGVKDEAELDALLKKQDDERKAKLSADERRDLERKEIAEENARLKAENAATKRDNAKQAFLRKAKATDDELLEALYEKASSAADFDGDKWLAEQKTKRPTLFEAAAGGGKPAPKAPPGKTTTGDGTQPGSGSPGGDGQADFEKMSKDEKRAFEQEMGLDARR